MAEHHHTPSSSPTCLDLSISVPGFASSSSFPSSAGEGSTMRDFDINKIPLRDEEEEAQWRMMMMTATGGGGGGGRGSAADHHQEEQEQEQEEQEGEYPRANGGRPRKKLRLTKEQSRLLEESFRLNHTLNPRQKEGLAMHLQLKPRQVEVWFQNRRARSKLKQTEMECEYLRRWFGSLTEQNRRLKKEVEELRLLKAGPPPTVMTPHSRDPLPASTLTMCPRCERVTTTASAMAYASASTSASTSNAHPAGRDSGAPRSTTNNNNQNNKNVSLSAKVPFLHSRQFSAAC